MTDDKENEKPDTPPADSGDDNRELLREITDEVLNVILDEHRKWLDSSGKEGKCANLRRTVLEKRKLSGVVLRDADLRGAILTGTDLRQADLRGDLSDAILRDAILVGANLKSANLQRAVLSHANLLAADLEKANLFESTIPRTNFNGTNLQGAVLSKAEADDANFTEARLDGASLYQTKLRRANFMSADLRNADLSQALVSGAKLSYTSMGSANLCGADLAGVDLTGVKQLHDANLQDCNLERATGLKGTEFARADITGARLPEDIRGFKSLAVVEEISKNARKIFFAMLLGCAYALLTIATTTDARLLTNSASSPLPIIGTEIPIAYFYIVAPFILIGLFVYLHLYLQRLWEGLSKLPAIFEDGKRLDERAYPWLLNGLVRRHFEKLKEGRLLMSSIEELTSIVLAWFAVPFTLTMFWLRYLWRHEWFGTALHIAFILGSVAGALFFYQLHALALSGATRVRFQFRHFLQKRWRYRTLAIIALPAVIVAASVGAIEGLFFTNDKGNVFSWARADLREAQLSIKPSNYWSLDPAVRDSAVIGADLKGADLRFANMSSAFLVHADLRFADLRGTDLYLTDLKQARLDSAILIRSNLTEANLSGATLRSAHLEDVDLDRSDMTGANLMGANLTKAALIATNLTNAEMHYCRLDSADLTDAVLSGVDLRRSVLGAANLTGTDLTLANLTGANLTFANFSGAILVLANLSKADLSYAVGVTQEQLFYAKGDTLTKLPPGLTIK